MITWVFDMKLMHIFHNQQTIRELADQQRGVILLFEIPKILKPQLPPINQIKKDNSNYGIDTNWVKIPVHIFKDNALLNLPRFVWAKKSWTLTQFHFEFFKLYKGLIANWYKDLKNNEGRSSFNRYLPKWTDPHSGEMLDFDSFSALSDEDKFSALFSGLREESWKDELSKRDWNIEDMPYQLRVENNAGYSQDCHFCSNYQCRKNCPVPFASKMTVLDMLHKVGVDDNTSFYQGKNGKSDFIINLIWHTDFDKSFQKHLSGVVTGVHVEREEEENELETGQKEGLTIDDCFKEFKREEILDEDNKWYCSKCKEHVQATKQLEIFKAPPILVINLKRFK